MGKEEIPEHVRGFLSACIDSVEQLEVLALLHDQPERDWSAAALSRELRSTESSVEKRLQSLVQRKVIEPVTAGAPFRYSPASPAVATTVAEVVSHYRLRPYRVMDIIFSKPINAMQSFADAFRFKKEDT